MSDPFLAEIEADAAVALTAESALRLLVADIRSIGDPPAQLLVALAKVEEALMRTSVGTGKFWRHLARNTIYEKIGRATLQLAARETGDEESAS